MKHKTKRRSYKNAIAIGIASFSSIALLSTGLASFVIIRNAQDVASGNIEVGTVDSTDITIEIQTGKTGEIRLDAAKDDFEGRVISDAANKGDRLIHPVTGEVEVASGRTLADNLKLEYIINIKTEDSVRNDQFVEHYIDSNMLSLAENFEFGKAYPLTPVANGDSEVKGNFAFDFALSWGSLFGNMNPSLYYDTEEGLNVSNKDVLENLQSLETAEKYTFEIIVIAIPK